MGVVHRVRDLERGEVVALKTMVRVAPNALLRFKQEFRALADISHPNVVQLYELVSEGDQWFFTMELVEGVDLLTWVASSLSLPPPPVPAALAIPAPTPGAASTLPAGAPQSVSFVPPLANPSALRPPIVPEGIAELKQLGLTMKTPLSDPRRPFVIRDVDRLRDAVFQLTSGLRAIHAAGKLHRDVKPSNVIVTRAGRVVLLDFGVASDAVRTPVAQSADEPLAGTPAYMAPEQCAMQPASPASDFYAMGVVLYEALTGRLPFEGQPYTLFFAKRESAPPPPSLHVAGIPSDLEELTMGLLDRDPRTRFTGEQVLERLGGSRSVRSSASASAPSSTDSDVPFVGRRAQLDDLRAAFDTSTSGLSVVLLHGRSGMGKSALAARFLGERAAQPEVLVLAGRCYEREAVPFKAIDPVVDELRRWLSRLPENDAAEYIPDDIAALARIFPVLGDLAERPRGASPEAFELDRIGPLELRRRGFAALRELFGKIAERYRLVVHVDDLQWCDADSVQLLEALFAAPSPAWMFVGAYRSELARSSSALSDLRDAIVELGAHCAFREVEIRELSEVEARELARALLVGSRDSQIAKVLTAEARGNPLFLAELARWAKERRVNVGEGAGITLEEVILERVKRLPEDARALLETLSVARGPLSHGVAVRAAKVAEKQRTPALLLRTARLVVTRGLADEDPIETVHDRIRETVAQSLDETRRRACHAGIAKALSEAPASDPEEVFAHYRAAADTENAKRWALPAAEAADRALAFLRAADLYEAAIALAAGPADVLDRKLGDALANAGRLTRAGDAYMAGAAHASARDRLELRRLAAESYLKSGRDERGTEVLRSVLDEVGLGYPASTERAIASILWNEAALRMAPLRRRLRTPQSVGYRDLARIDAAFAASTGLSLSDPVRGADFALRGLSLALEAGEPVRLCRALAMAASNTAARGEAARGRAEDLVREAERIAENVDEPHAVGLALLAAGTVHFFLGEWRSARAKLERADRTFRDRCRAVTWELANTSAWTCNVLILSGELAEASRRVPSLLDEALGREDRFALIHLVYPGCVSRLVADDLDGARHIATVGSPGSSKAPTAGHWGAFISLASLDRYRGDGLAAWRKVDEISSALDRSPLMRSAMVRIFSHYERGLSACAAAAAGHDRHRAIRTATKWSKELSKEKLRYGPAFGHLLRAGIEAVRGDREASLAELDRAVPKLDEADLGYLASCARYRRGEMLGGSVGRELMERARAFFVAQGVVNIERCLAMSAPGFKS
ncbi:MAG: AAA family ATPase [Deltaproteobacteria bacterium]|nr:AAA family ATPase [Deltaproteobacteria bacterium]